MCACVRIGFWYLNAKKPKIFWILVTTNDVRDSKGTEDKEWPISSTPSEDQLMDTNAKELECTKVKPRPKKTYFPSDGKKYRND